MTKLRIDAIDEDKPVTVTVRLPVQIHRELVAYAEVLKRNGGQVVDPTALIAPMIKRFMASDRAFRKALRQN